MTTRDFIAVMSSLAEHLDPDERLAACRFAAELANPDTAALAATARRRRELEHAWEQGEIAGAGGEPRP